jgi:hypothetical protein
MDRERLADLLDDLQHDLCKHAALPLRLLPKGASDAEVRAAVAQGLLHTQRGPLGVTSAERIWQRFCQDAPAEWRDLPGAAEVEAAVADVLAWQDKLGMPAPIDRQAIERDLAAMAVAVWRWRERV